VFQPARKFESEITQEKLPIYSEQHVANFGYAYKQLVQLRAELDLQLSAHQDAFALFDGSSPTPDFVAGNIKRLCKHLLPPSVAVALDYSNHCLRRGGDTCLNVMGVDPLVAKQLGARSQNSRSRELYVERCLEQLAKKQQEMLHVGEYTLLQDELGWNEQIERNPALNPLLNEQLELGQEYASSDDEDEGASSAPEPAASAVPLPTEKSVSITAPSPPPPPSLVDAANAHVAADCRALCSATLWSPGDDSDATPKRKRRTKAEMAAARSAESASSSDTAKRAHKARFFSLFKARAPR
jgi:hypothetical protein